MPGPLRRRKGGNHLCIDIVGVRLQNAQSMNSPLGRRIPPVIAILTFLVLGMLYVAAVPPWEAPDEPWHLAHAEALAAGHVPDEAATYEAHQPPLYYALVAATLRLGGIEAIERAADNPWYPFATAALWHTPDDTAVGQLALLRTLSGFLGALVVALTWSVARAAWRRGRTAPFLAALVAAALPQFVHISHAITNDTLAALVGALVSYGLVLWSTSARGTWRVATILGIGALMAVMTKLNAAVLLLAVVPVALGVAWRDRRLGWSVVLRHALVPAAAVALGASCAVTLLAAIAPGAVESLAGQAALRGGRIDPHLASWPAIAALARGVLVSTWARFGWLSVDLPWWTTLAAGCVAGAGLVWCVVLWWRGHAARRLVLGSLALVIAVQLAAVLRSGLIDAQPQGRLAYPALAAFATLVAVGWSALVPRRAQRPMVIGAMLALVGVNFYTAVVVLPEAYAPYVGPMPLVDTRIVPPRWVVVADLVPREPAVEQTFVPRTDLVTRVSVPVASARGEGALLVALQDGEGRPVSSRRIELSEIEPSSWVSIKVPEGTLSAGHSYTLQLRIESASADARVDLWGAREEIYPQGGLTAIRDEGVAGDRRSARAGDLMLLITGTTQ
jgi:hypothetical protein